MPGKALEMATVAGVFEIHPTDDGGDRLGRVRDTQQVVRFLDRGGRLDKNGPGDAVLSEAGRKIGRQAIACEDRVILGHLVIIAPLGFPEVLMSVDLDGHSIRAPSLSYH
ncbi:MAG: hypothetical protein IH905_01080 [Proteobacteria bacterium]|nr:hypothetical protein [Pseudomonadota bacterium]